MPNQSSDQSLILLIIVAFAQLSAINSLYYINTCQQIHAKDSQKIKIKKKTKTPRITDEGWNSQKWLSDPVEKKIKEGRKDSCIFI